MVIFKNVICGLGVVTAITAIILSIKDGEGFYLHIIQLLIWISSFFII